MNKLPLTALIAFGSNRFSFHGDEKETLIWAAGQVARLSLSPPHTSRLYATPAFPAGAGPDFVNAVMRIETDLAPQDILTALHAIEADAQRERQVRWGQRTLDLDLIAVGQQVLPDLAGYEEWRKLPLDQQAKLAPEGLILPHPRLQDRGFVLVPLCDVAPDWQHPVLGLTVRQMCAALPAKDRHDVVPIDPLPL